MTPRLVQGRNQRICLGEADSMGGPNLRLMYLKIQLSKAAALPALPLITPSSCSVGVSQIIMSIKLNYWTIINCIGMYFNFEINQL